MQRETEGERQRVSGITWSVGNLLNWKTYMVNTFTMFFRGQAKLEERQINR